MCRIWLRKLDPWHRYLNPRMGSHDWDCRVYIKSDSAFALQSEMTVNDLDSLEEAYSFPNGADGLAALALNGDPVHDRVVVWARKVTGAPELPAPATVSPVQIPVRYSASTAVTAKGEAVPPGRPAPPMQPLRPFSPALVKPAPVAPSAAVAQSAPASAGSPSAAARPAPAAAPPRAAVPPPARPSMPPPVSAARPDLSERLQAMRKSAEGESNE